MPTRQVLFGLALLGAAGTGWTDDFTLDPASKMAVDTGVAGSSGSTARLPRNPAALAMLPASAGRAAWPLAAGSGGYVAAPLAGGGLLVGQRLDGQASVGLGMHESVMPLAAGGTDPSGRDLTPELALRSVQPTFAYRISDALSVGVGLRLTQGTVSRRMASGTVPAGTMPSAYIDSDTSTGVDLGMLYRLSENTLLGLAYASSSRLDLDARSGPLNAPGLGQSTRLMQAPQSITASFSHRLDSGWVFSATLGWQDWSGFDNSPALASGDYQYQDTWQFALGAEQLLSERLSWTVGVKYGSSSQGGKSKGKVRTLVDPMPESLRLAAGLRYQVDKDMELQFGYNLTRFGAAQVRPSKLASTDQILSTEPASSNVSVIGGGMVWRF